MELLDKLKRIKGEQKTLQESFEALSREIESSPVYNENEKLKAELAELKERFAKLSESHSKLSSENENLRLSLHEQIMDEKLNILKITEEKLKVYFKKGADGYANRLTALQKKVESIVDDLNRLSKETLDGEEKQFLREANELYARVNERVKAANDERRRQEQEEFNSMRAGLQAFSEEGLDESTIQSRIKQSKFEMKIGLHLLNKVGIVLIVIGVAFFAYYNRTNIADWVKSALFYLAGIGFLIGGEVLYRRKMKPFALAMIGGGFAILYTATFFSFFLLKTIGMEPALGISVLVTITALALSLRYDSKVVISLALVGGFIPFTSYAIEFGFSGFTFYIAMGYLFMLNLLVLGVSFFKKWNISNYLSFLLNVPALSYLVFSIDNEVVAILYTAVTFAMYLTVILAYPLLNKESLKAADMVLLALNTFISSLFIFILFEKAGWGDYRAVLPVIFSIIYGALGYFTAKIIKTEKISSILFYLTGLAFAVVAIPLLLEPEFISMGWLVEGTLLVIYGYKNRSKLLERSGWVIYLLCLATFLLFDSTYWAFERFYNGSFSSQLYNLKFLFVTASMAAVTTIYQLDIKAGTLPEFGLKAKLIKAFKVASIFTINIFLVYITLFYFNDWVELKGSFNLFFSLIMAALITFGISFALPRIELYYDKTVKVVTTILRIIFGFIFYLNLFFVAPVNNYGRNYLLLTLAIALLVGVSFLFMFNLRLSIINFLKKSNYYLELYPITMGAVFLFNLTIFVLIQLDLDRFPIILTLLYILTALTFIIYGFWRRYIYIRFFGLGLIFVALGKLFIYDLWDIRGSQKVIAYLTMGALMILIGFVYQLVDKKLNQSIVLKPKAEEPPKESNNEDINE